MVTVRTNDLYSISLIWKEKVIWEKLSKSCNDLIWFPEKIVGL